MANDFCVPGGARFQIAAAVSGGSAMLTVPMPTVGLGFIRPRLHDIG
jgi:hypothetical protein